MTEKCKHIIFYDGDCGFCNQTIHIILKADTKKIFAFASLQGKTAYKFLHNLPANLRKMDSIILVENFEKTNYKIYVMSHAIFRICWLLGGLWTLWGSLNFLPACLFDWAYRLVALIRRKIFISKCIIPSEDEKSRFLP
jgi:predicted DCC family thiol-disulfide oxidoreductase YuxK